MHKEHEQSEVAAKHRGSAAVVAAGRWPLAGRWLAESDVNCSFRLENELCHFPIHSFSLACVDELFSLVQSEKERKDPTSKFYLLRSVAVTTRPTIPPTHITSRETPEFSSSSYTQKWWPFGCFKKKPIIQINGKPDKGLR